MNTLKRQNQNKIARIIRFYPRALFYTFTLLMVLSIGSCRKNNFSIDSPENIKNELQNWLSLNGRNFTTGELLIKNSQGEYERKSLDWDNVTYFRINGYDYYEVPYSSLSRTGPFQSTNNKNSSNEVQKKYSLVFQKSIHGETLARIKRVVYGDSLLAVKSGTKKYWAAIFFDDMVGESKSTWVLLNQKEQKPIQVFKTHSASISISSSSTTARKSVEGGGDNCIVTTLPLSEYQCTGSNTSGDYDVTCGYVSVGYSVFSQCLRPPEEGGGEDNFQYTIYFGGGGRPAMNTTTIIDSLQGYPCASSILNSFPINGSCIEINTLIFDVFQVNNNVNLTFKIDPTLTVNSENGYAYPPMSGTDYYEQSVYLNPWVLQNSTREFIASTIMHESIHSVIDYWRSRYDRWRIDHNDPTGIDSNQFKGMFPIFWDYRRALTNVELAQHNQMAESYINSFVTYLKKFTPSINNSMAIALAWKGLQETNVWKSRSDTMQLLTLQHISRRDNADSVRSLNYSLTKCP